VIVATAVLTSATVIAFQGPGTPPRLAYPLNTLPTDAEIAAALKGDDDRLKEVIVRRAKELPPHALRDTTVKAIGAEIIKLRQEVLGRFKQDPLSVNEGNSNSEYVRSLAELLMHQNNPAGINGLVAVVHMGAPGETLVEFGEAAVPSLISVARSDLEDDPGHADAAMDVLEQMLESPIIRPKLSGTSRAAIREVAAQRLMNTRGDDNWHTLATAVQLAVATRDPQLRKQVMELIDNDVEFVRRGMSVKWQQEVSAMARQSLARFPQ
jgi:hypothetical protein